MTASDTVARVADGLEQTVVEPASGYERRIVRERDGRVIWPESAETLRAQFEAMARAAGPTPQGPLAVPMAIPPDER